MWLPWIWFVGVLFAVKTDPSWTMNPTFLKEHGCNPLPVLTETQQEFNLPTKPRTVVSFLKSVCVGLNKPGTEQKCLGKLTRSDQIKVDNKLYTVKQDVECEHKCPEKCVMNRDIKVLNDKTCEWTCTRQHKCPQVPKMSWNADLCKCECTNRKFCQPGFELDERTCECIKIKYHRRY